MFRRLSLSALFFLSACRCEPIPLQPLKPGQLRFSPERVTFAPTWVGLTGTASVEVLNTQGASVSVPVSIAEPFITDVTELSLSRGEARTITLTFTPRARGLAAGVLQVGNLELTVEGEGVEAPACTTTNVCASVRFDFGTAQCLETARADGASCATACVTGSCTAGVCTGALANCDDGDLCTIDACSEEDGCTNSPRSCPIPSDPCRAARCDSTSGCGEEEVPDGTLCGPDDCTASTVDVCIAGRCSPRARPDVGRCANRWVPTTIPARRGHAMAFDSIRSQVVVFGGAGAGAQLRDDTWVWDGQAWRQRLPIASPPARAYAVMSFDAVRRRAVLFGGEPSDPATWEWDGLTWLRRAPASSPSPRTGHAMAFDPVGQRTVLFGGSGNTTFGDTWEWDGSRWLVRAPTRSPGPRLNHSMAWDPARRRIVLFGGGFGGALNDTWEWDGATWTERDPPVRPPPRYGASFAWNGVSNRLVLFGGTSDTFEFLNDTWEWDGTTWTQRQLGSRPYEAAPMVWSAGEQRTVLFGRGASSSNETWAFDGTEWMRLEGPLNLSRDSTAFAWDPARQRAVLFGGGLKLDTGPRLEGNDTWEWSGGAWFSTNPLTRPTARRQHAISGTRNGVLLFGGGNDGALLADTWLWNGARWDNRTPTSSPQPRRLHALSWDSTRERVVLFGGNDTLSDTWEWDGNGWLEASPLTSPPGRQSHALAFDRARQRTLLFGGERYGVHLADTWEWDGSTWVQRVTGSAPSPRSQHAMVFDPSRQRVLLFGGTTASRASSETWEWDGAAWSQRSPISSPPAGVGWMVFDEGLEKVALFDGNEVWLFLP